MDHAFDYQLDTRGVEIFFQTSDEVIIRELEIYIEDRKKIEYQE